MIARIAMPWPPRALWLNARPHWRDERRARAKQREMAFWLARGQRLHLHPDPRARLWFDFHPPDRRRRDMQNLPSTMKGTIDGIADAMRVDDAGFIVHWPVKFSLVTATGLVVLTIEVQA